MATAVTILVFALLGAFRSRCREGPALSSRKDAKQLIKSAKDLGFTVEVMPNGHYRVALNGRFCTTLGGTPSDGRGLLNARAAMKRALRQEVAG